MENAMKKILFVTALSLLAYLPAIAGTNYNVCFNSLDVDQNGVMSKSEFLVAFSSGDVAVFDTADTNKDGQVSRAEWEAYRKSKSTS